MRKIHDREPLEKSSLEAVPGARRAFTLIELLVVITIMIVLLGIAVPAVKSLTRNNAQTQAINTIRAYLSTARSVAISQHRMAGVVFFEESARYSFPANPGQTALQLIVESSDQTGAASGVTVFTHYSVERQYLPAGIQLATLNDSSSRQLSNSDTTIKSRIILFDANGQLLLRNGIAHPNVNYAISAPGGYPQSYGDWGSASYPLVGGQPNVSGGRDWSIAKVNAAGPFLGVSTPGVLVYSAQAYKDANLPDEATSITWMKEHGTILIVNAYTGNIIQ